MVGLSADGQLVTRSLTIAVGKVPFGTCPGVTSGALHRRGAIGVRRASVGTSLEYVADLRRGDKNWKRSG